MTERSFTQFLRESLALLRVECRPAHARMAQLLQTLEVAIDVDGELMSVVAQRGELSVLATPTAPDVRAHTSKGALAQLLEGQCTLLEAVWDERVWLLGNLDDVLAFHAALETYFNGAVRCPAFPDLLARFLGSSAQRQRAAKASPDEPFSFARGIPP